MVAEDSGFTLSESSGESSADTTAMPRAQRDHSLQASQPSGEKAQTPKIFAFGVAGALVVGALWRFLQQRKKRRGSKEVVEPVDVSRLLEVFNIKPPAALPPPNAPPVLAGLKFLLSRE